MFLALDQNAELMLSLYDGLVCHTDFFHPAFIDIVEESQHEVRGTLLTLANRGLPAKL